MRSPLYALLIFLFSTFSVCGQDKLRDGDILFIVNPSGQGRAIQLATHSKFTHVGVVFIEKGEPVVYHAVEPVMRSTLKHFLGFSADGRYEVRRLKDQSPLTADAVERMRKAAASEVGKHYDIGFSWDNEKLYCSEFVWKVYDRALGIAVGPLKPLSSFDLTHPAVKAKLEERYGSKIPLDEKMVSPGDIYDSPLLQ